MNIPHNLKLLREANSVDAANTLLAAGWILMAITPSTRDDHRLTYVFGWSETEAPIEPEKPARTPGNLSSDARQ
jgi:hypothetical protein